MVDRNNSIYRFPIDSRCRPSAFGASFSSANNTKASPVARPSDFLTNRIPSVPSSTLHGSWPVVKNSSYFRTHNITTKLKGMRIHVYRRNVQIYFCLQILTTCLGVQSYGNPRMRMITSKLLDKNACASYDAPPATLRKSSPVARYTSIYRLPI